MATPVQGTTTQVYLNGHDIGSFVQDISNSFVRDMFDKSTLNSVDANGDAVKEYAPGQGDATVSAEGWFATSATTPGSEDAGSPDKIINDALDSTNGNGGSIVTVLPAGDVLGAGGYGLRGHLSKAEIKAGPSDLVKTSVEVGSNVARERVVCLTPVSTKSSAGNSTGVDNGAASAVAGWSAYLQGLVHTSGTATVVVADSPDDLTYTTRGTFANITADNVSERITGTGTLARYARAGWSGTFNAAFGVYLHRNR